MASAGVCFRDSFWVLGGVTYDKEGSDVVADTIFQLDLSEERFVVIIIVRQMRMRNAVRVLPRGACLKARCQCSVPTREHFGRVCLQVVFVSIHDVDI